MKNGLQVLLHWPCEQWTAGSTSTLETRQLAYRPSTTARLKNPIDKPQCELMRGPHNLMIYPNASYARAFGPLSCTCTCVCVGAHVRVRARTCVYEGARMCVHALCTCMHVYTVVYVCVCVRCVLVRAGQCVRAHTWCVHAHVKGLKTPFLLVSFLPKRGPASQAVCPPWGP